MFYLDVPLMAHVITKAALYCRDAIFWRKELLKAQIINYIAIIKMSPNKKLINS